MTKSKLHNALLAVALAGGLFAGAGSAYATPGTVFVATENIAFDPDSAVPGVEPGGFLNISSSELEWVDTGDATDPHSFLRIIGPTGDPVNITSDDGVWRTTAQIQHENNVIPVGSFAFFIDTIASFTLTGATFDSTGSDTLGPVTLGVDFLESSNVAPCTDTPNPLGSICDDTFDVSGLNVLLTTQLFSAFGERWAIDFRLLANEDLGTAFDAANNRIFTAESEESEILFQAMIRQLEVPEPATLALLGIGLMGLPLARRRSAKKV